jgi:hypothetical protein
MIGKWDVGHYAKAYVPTQRGFDGFFGYYSACVVGRCFLPFSSRSGRFA